MPGAIRRNLRREREAGEPVKHSRDCRQSPKFLLLPFLSCLSLVAGCAARHVTANNPAPSPPEAASPGAIEASKGETSVGPGPTPIAPAPTARRGKPPLSSVPEGYVEEGNASWYGDPFNGRRSSNGEIYDMNKFTAAHRTLPFNTMVRVTNLNNGKSTTVRITDRGPFVQNRILDLSLAAARAIDSVGPGVVPVRLEVITPGIDLTAGYFTVQVGAFRDPNNAQRLRDRLSVSYSPIFIQRYDAPDGTYFRVRVGKVSGEDAAQRLGEQLHGHEGFTPFVVRLDEGAGAGGNE